MDPDRLCMSCMTDKGDAAVCPACGVAEVEPDPHGLFLPPRTILDRQYLLGRVLGHGGFGVTYLAWDLTLERRLAVKEYFPREFGTRASDQQTVVAYSGEKEDLFYYGLRKFLAEGRALAKFQDHPGIVSGLNYLEANGTAYLVMEYMEGETLEAYLRSQPEGRLSFAISVSILMHVMDALRSLHQEGIIHRDVSPDNIYLSRAGQVKLLDFGSARHALGARSRSMDVVIKRGFSPLEQYQEKGEIGPWTDVYAVAATLYRLITGRLPPEALARLSEETLEAPSELNVAIPAVAEDTLLAALGVQRSDRLQSIEALQQPLLAAMDEADRLEQRRPESGAGPRLEPAGDARHDASASPTEVLDSGLLEAIDSPLAGVRERAVRQLGHLLQDDDETLVLAAHQALTQLAADDSRRVSTSATEVLASHGQDALSAGEQRTAPLPDQATHRVGQRAYPADELPDPYATSGPVMQRAARNPRILAAIGALVVLLALAGVWAFRGSPEEPNPLGNLSVRVSPRAYATLEGWKTPDDGQSLGTFHSFSDLDARTYPLKVWRPGYRTDQRKVTIRAGTTTDVAIELVPQ